MTAIQNQLTAYCNLLEANDPKWVLIAAVQGTMETFHEWMAEQDESRVVNFYGTEKKFSELHFGEKHRLYLTEVGEVVRRKFDTVTENE